VSLKLINSPKWVWVIKVLSFYPKSSALANSTLTILNFYLAAALLVLTSKSTSSMLSTINSVSLSLLQQAVNMVSQYFWAATSCVFIVLMSTTCTAVVILYTKIKGPMPPSCFCNLGCRITKSSLQTGANSRKLVYLVKYSEFCSSWEINYFVLLCLITKCCWINWINLFACASLLY